MPTPKITPDTVVTLAADDAYLRSRAPPTAPDGRYDWETSGSYSGMRPEGHAGLSNLLTAVRLIHTQLTFCLVLVSCDR